MIHNNTKKNYSFIQSYNPHNYETTADEAIKCVLVGNDLHLNTTCWYPPIKERKIPISH